MISLNHLVRANGSQYVEPQSLVRSDDKVFDNHPEVLRRFRQICSNIFTFVDTWNHPRITSQTIRIFSKIYPAKEALMTFKQDLLTHIITIKFSLF